MRAKKTVVSFLAVALVLGITAAAFAETAVYEWPASDAPVLVENEAGLVLLGAEGEPLRAFSWKRNDGERDRAVRLLDMTGNGAPNIVGSGEPSFVLGANGEPIFSIEEGCQQLILAKMTRSRGQDLVCVNRRDVRAFTGDGQLVWGMEPGRNVEYCRVGDITGSGRDDVECKYQGREQYVRIGHDGAMLEGAGEVQRLEEDQGGVQREVEPVAVKEWAGLEELELEGEVQAVLEKAVEGKVVVVTDQKIYVIGEGEQGEQEVASFSADAGDYRRVPFADLVSVYARNFQDDEAARAAVERLQDEISKCYGARLRAAPYAGSGRQMLQVSVDEGGAVQSVSQTASQVGDRQVERCAQRELEGGEYPAALDGEVGTINVNILFTFRDEER